MVLGVVFGSALGFGFRHLMRFCERKDLIDRKSYVAQYLALALFSVGSTTLIGSDDLLSAFASGSAFAWDGFFNKQTEDSAFSSVIDLIFNIAGALLLSRCPLLDGLLKCFSSLHIYWCLDAVSFVFFRSAHAHRMAAYCSGCPRAYIASSTYCIGTLPLDS